MRFLLRATFWLGLVLVLLPNSSSHPVPKLQVSPSQAFSAAKGVVTDEGFWLHIVFFQKAAHRMEHAAVQSPFGEGGEGPLDGVYPWARARPAQHTPGSARAAALARARYNELGGQGDVKC